MKNIRKLWSWLILLGALRCVREWMRWKQSRDRKARAIFAYFYGKSTKAVTATPKKKQSQHTTHWFSSPCHLECVLLAVAVSLALISPSPSQSSLNWNECDDQEHEKGISLQFHCLCRFNVCVCQLFLLIIRVCRMCTIESDHRFFSIQ